MSPAQAQAPVEAASAPEGATEIQTLESQVQVVLTEARRQQQMLADMRQRLADADAANAWLPWLVLGLLMALGAVAWLALRVHRLRSALRRQRLALHEANARAQAAADSAEPADDAPLIKPGRPLLSGAGPAPAVAASEADAVPTGTQPAGRTLPLQGRDLSLGSGVPPRPVSVEELLDLDQQVDFFLVLGQAQSAIDLLLGHVRATGGTSALPYFKLLEIYRIQGDQEAYDRTRERFNQRFNAQAPDWSGDLGAGRSLEDYPDTLVRLQRAWPQPMRAVAELESLLLRRADLEPFDLPAYRDVLMLHALVRDLPAGALASAASAAPAVASASTMAASMAASMGATPPLSALVPGSTMPAALTREPFAMPPVGRPPVAQPVSRPTPEEEAGVDLLLPLGDHAMDTTMPQPHVPERLAAHAMLADWVLSREPLARPSGPADLHGGVEPTGVASRPMRLDLDLSDYAPAPREFTRPAAFTDIHLRRDHPLSGLGGFDDRDSDPSPLPSRR